MVCTRILQGTSFAQAAAAAALTCLFVAVAPAQQTSSVGIDLGQTNVGNGMVAFNGGDGTTQSLQIGGVDCRTNQISGGGTSGNYLYLGITDTWALFGSVPDVWLTIRYYDSGTSTLRVEYDAASSAYLPTITIPCQNTLTWRTYSWHVSDAWFGNRQNFGADLRVAVSPGNVFFIDQVFVASGRAADIDLGTTNVGHGIVLRDGGDGHTAPATIGSVDCRGNVNPAADFYFYFSVDDGFCFDGTRPDLAVTVEYWDAGTDWMTLQYDSEQNGAYRTAAFFNRQNTNTWRTHTWHVRDAGFRNGENLAADFRIAAAGQFYLNRIWLYDGHKVVCNLGTSN